MAIDGAAAVPVGEAVAQQGNALERHEDLLQNLAASNNALYNQVSSLTERLNELSARPPPPAPLVNPLNVVPPVKEPHVPDPERYHGDFGSCQAFLTQVSLVFKLQPHSYSTDEARIAYLVSLLSGPARDWGAAIWEKQGPVCRSYAAFTEEMRSNFDHPVKGRGASSRLMHIQQGSRSVAEYALEFRTLAAETDWNDSSLQEAFYTGLNESLKDQLALGEEPSSLEQEIAVAMKRDNRMRERRRERRVRSFNPPPVAKTPTYTAPVSAPAADPEPMQLGRAKLTTEEKKHRRDTGLCLYCGKPGHFVSECPRLPVKGAAPK